MRHEVVQLQGGWAGTDKTVAKINSIVLQGLTDPTVVITAQNLVRHLPERDKGAEIRAVSNFVRKNIRYTNEGIETIKTPRVLLDEIRNQGRAVGDCDDHVILWMTLHRALGNPTRVKVVSQRENGIASHIYGEVLNKQTGKWISDDTIVKRKPLGWSAPPEGLTKSKTYSGVGGLGTMELIEASNNGIKWIGGAQRYQRTGWVPGKQHMGIAQDTVPSSFRVRRKLGQAVSVAEHEPGELGFISGDLMASITQGLSTVVGAYGKYKSMKEEAKEKKREVRRRAEEAMARIKAAAAEAKALKEQAEAAAAAAAQAATQPGREGTQRTQRGKKAGISTTTMALMGGGALVGLFVLMQVMKK